MKIKISVINIFLIGVTFFNYAQAPDVKWSKSFGGTDWDDGYTVQQTPDGGFIIFGSTSSSGSGGADAWLIRTDNQGEIVWTNTIGFNELEHCRSGMQTPNGDFVLTGSTNSIGAGSYDVLLARTNSSGDTLWVKAIGEEGYESANAIDQLSNGGFIIAGASGETVPIPHDVLLTRTNASGNPLWTKTFGGTDHDEGSDVIQNSDGGFTIVGYTESFGSGDFDVWLICTDGTGNSLWTKTFGGEEQDMGYSIIQASNGDYLITGWTYSFGNGDSDVILIRVDGGGNTIWTKTYGGTGSDAGANIIKTNDGGFIITGTTTSFSGDKNEVMVIKVDSLGNTLWTKTIEADGNAFGYSTRRISEDSYIIAGTIFPSGRTDSDIFLTKLTSENLTDVNFESSTKQLQFQLYQNYPNPFNPKTKISWQSSVNNWQTLKIYDILGNEVTKLVDEYKPAGNYEVTFDATGLPSGIYFSQLHIDGHIQTQKMMFLK